MTGAVTAQRVRGRHNGAHRCSTKTMQYSLIELRPNAWSCIQTSICVPAHVLYVCLTELTCARSRDARTHFAAIRTWRCPTLTRSIWPSRVSCTRGTSGKFAASIVGSRSNSGGARTSRGTVTDNSIRTASLSAERERLGLVRVQRMDCTTSQEITTTSSEMVRHPRRHQGVLRRRRH